MSLEQTIADLVAASNNLTGTINTKMNEIDQKVDEATASVPDTIKGMAEMEFHVDAIDGDDENGDGGPTNPYKTITHLNNKLVSGSFTVIKLRGGQEHFIDGFGPNIPSGVILFLSWGEGLGNAKMKWAPKYNSNTNQYHGRAVGLQSGTIIMRGVDVYTDMSSGDAGLLSNDASFFGYSNSDYSVVVYNAYISLKNAPLVTAHAGYSGRDISIGRSSIEVVESLNNMAKLLWNRATTFHSFRLDAADITLINGLTWADLVDYHSDKRNLLTSLDLV